MQFKPQMIILGVRIMDKQPSIYAIYMMSQPWHLDEANWPSCGIREFTGFYYEKETAIKAIEENWCDIQDHCFHAAEIREITPGLYPHPPQSKCLYYEWDEKEEHFKKKPFPKLGKGWDEEFKKE